MRGSANIEQSPTSQTDAGVKTFHYPPPWDGVSWGPRPSAPQWRRQLVETARFALVVIGGAMAAGAALNAILGAAANAMTGMG